MDKMEDSKETAPLSPGANSSVLVKDTSNDIPSPQANDSPQDSSRVSHLPSLLSNAIPEDQNVSTAPRDPALETSDLTEVETAPKQSAAEKEDSIGAAVLAKILKQLDELKDYESGSEDGEVIERWDDNVDGGGSSRI